MWHATCKTFVYFCCFKSKAGKHIGQKFLYKTGYLRVLGIKSGAYKAYGNQGAILIEA